MNVIRSDQIQNRHKELPSVQNIRPQTVGLIPRSYSNALSTGLTKYQTKYCFKSSARISSAPATRTSSGSAKFTTDNTVSSANQFAKLGQAADQNATKKSSSILSILNNYGNKITSNGQSSKQDNVSLSSVNNRASILTAANENTNYKTTTSSGSRSGLSNLRTPLRTPIRTPKSTTTATSENDAICIVAVCEGRGHARGEVGIAAIDIRHPHLTLCQISDNQSYISTLTKLNVLNPVEILVPHTICDIQQSNKLFMSLSETFPTVTLTSIQRRLFSETSGLTQIRHLCSVEYASVELIVQHKFYALASAAALLKYVEHIQNKIFTGKSLKIEYEGSQNCTIIDIDTANRLELVRSLRGSGNHLSLIGILDRCHTGCGSRLLRSSILQPSCHFATIKSRLDSVKEIVDKPDLLNSLESTLPKFWEVDRLLSLCMHIPQQDSLKAAETQLNYILLLKSILELLPPLGEILAECKTEFLKSVKELTDEECYSDILKRLLDTVQSDAHITKGYAASHMQRSFAVKPQVNVLLDVARKTYCEVIDDITRMVKQLSEEYNLPLRVNFNATRGFHIQMTLGKKPRFNINDLPPIFIQVQKSRSTYTFTTQLLIHADERCKEASREVQMLSNVVILDLLNEIRTNVGCIYKLCEKISELDMLASFAKLSSMPRYVCPQFGDILDVKDSRHPILEFINPTEPVPNNIFATKDKNFHIITGANMSGKSIYIRQIVLIQIMAQIGCYVPATAAEFRISDRIFSRIGFDDSIESNASTFVLEIKEVQCILQNITPTSLVIMDELCRGTSCEEGTAMAWALCEELLEKKAFTFLTTHFHFLTRLEDLHSNVVNHHFETVEVSVNDKINLNYSHRLLEGSTCIEYYGLHLARTLSMPESVVERAQHLAHQISQQRKAVLSEESQTKARPECELTCELLTLQKSCNLNQEKCKQLKNKFSLLMQLDSMVPLYEWKIDNKSNPSLDDCLDMEDLHIARICATVLSDIITQVVSEL